MRAASRILACLLGLLLLVKVEAAQDSKTVFLAILARNKAHLLPHYLRCIENLDYKKSLITLYVNTNDNCDQTEEILLAWIAQNQSQYHGIVYETADYALDRSFYKPHDWTMERLTVLSRIRERSLRLAQELKCDYYFVVDCDNFIAPCTLRTLMEKRKPIIAPMLRSFPEPGDLTSTFFAAVRKDGYYANHPDFVKIVNWEKRGTFKVPLVHCTYLIDGHYFKKLTYLTNLGEYEFIAFARVAREKGVDQYICNEKKFGTNLRFNQSLSLEEEVERVKGIPLSNFMHSGPVEPAE